MPRVNTHGGSLRLRGVGPYVEILETRRLLACAAGDVETAFRPPVSAAVTSTSRPYVTGTDPANGSTNVMRDAFVAAYVHLPNVGAGVKASTLSSSTVKLYKSSDATKTPVAANLNTTGAGDAIILQPKSLLAASTKYTFEITSGVTDTSGAAFTPYTMSFTTGTQPTTTSSSIAFDKVSLPIATSHRYTGVTIGPDGRLYACTMDGAIFRYDVRADGTLGSVYQIDSIKAGNGGASRLITGIRFDPTSTASNLILWVTHGDHTELNAPDWTGKLSRLSGTNLSTYRDYVVGLPRSVKDHMTNQIDFDSQNRMYVSQASMTALGAPDSAWGYRSEHLLSAAILRVDYNAIASRIAAGQGPVNVKSESGGTYSPYASGAPVTLYATGVRNAYDILWHSNGKLYAPTNGSAPGGNTPAGAGVPGLTNVSVNEPDWLFSIKPGRYYGHPNPKRAEYALNGANPTSGADKYEVTQYPVGTHPDADWDPAIYKFGNNYSPDGLLEYKSSTFGGQLKGSMLVCRYSGGDDVMVMTPDSNGNIASVKTGLSGMTGFSDPLDIAELVGPGYLYVAEHGANKITLLRPYGSGSTTTSVAVRGPRTLFFNDPRGGVASPTRTAHVKNTGGSSYNITGVSIIGTDAALFSVVSRPSLPKSMSPGGTADVTVAFNPSSGTSLGVKTATLRITTSSTATPTIDFTLRALATLGEGGSNEPSLQRILDLYLLPLRAGDGDPGTANLPLPLGANDTVNVQRLVKAHSGPVTIEPLAVFASPASPSSIKFGYYNTSTGSRTQVMAITESQSVNPTINNGSVAFDPGWSTFGLWANAPAVSSTRFSYSEDAKNTWEPVSANRKKCLVFPLKDRSGAVIANSYVVAWEEVTGSYDYQDFVAVIRNVRPG
jgi:glucose/arabinose dehydrogenase